MKSKIFREDNLVILKEEDRFFIRYDAGAHLVALREDEISEQEANEAMTGKKEATRVLFALRKRVAAMRHAAISRPRRRLRNWKRTTGKASGFGGIGVAGKAAKEVGKNI